MEIEIIIDSLIQIEKKQTLDFSIEVLDLSIRVRHALLRSRIYTIGDLVKNWETVPRVRNLGAKGILEITEKVNLWYQTEGVLSLSGFANFVPGNHVVVIDEQTTGDQATDERPTWQDESLSNIPVEALDLPVRVYRVLKRENINRIGQIYIEWKNIGSFRNIGPTALEQIQKAIASLDDSNNEKKTSPNANLLNKGSQDGVSESLLISQNHYALVKVSVSELQLSKNAFKVLKDSNIETIDQISLSKLREMSSVKDVDLAVIRQIYTALMLWLSGDEKRKYQYLTIRAGKEINSQPEKIGFREYLDALFKILKPHTRAVIEIRYGLKTGKKATLQETSEQFGVTRERIRQIEKRGLEKIYSGLIRMAQSPLFEEIEKCVTDRGGLISNSRLAEQLNSAFADINFHSGAILEFLSNLFEKIRETVSTNSWMHSVVYLIDVDGWSTSFFDKEQILQATNQICEILTKAESPIQWEELFSKLICEAGLLTLDEGLAYAIALCLSDNQQIQRQTDGGWVFYKKEKRYDRIISVMRKIGQPAHFSEIAELYNQTFSDQPRSEHNIHGVISGREEFVRVGRGKYGLAEWGIHDDGNVANAVRRILVSHQHPMAFADIMNEVLKTWDVQKSAIVAAIESDARFSKTEDGKIWLTETGLTIQKRIKRDDDTRGDRLLIVLRELGLPSPVKLIVETHNKSYPERPLTIPSVKSLMFRNTELFIRTGPNEFGLVEWELEPYKEIPLTDRSSEILEIIKEQAPVRFDDLRNLYNQRYPDRIMGINSLRGYLGKMEGVISSPKRGLYQLTDQGEATHQVTAPSRKNMNNRDKLASVIKEIGIPAHIDDVVVKYKQLFPDDNKEYGDIRSALYNNRKTLVNFGAGIFGLPGWDAPQKLPRHLNPSTPKASLSSRHQGRLERVLKIFAELNHPSRATLILEQYNQLYPETPISLKGLYDVFDAHKESFVKVSAGVYSLRTWNPNTLEVASPYSRRERLIVTLQTIGAPAKINDIIQKHNELFPERPLSYDSANHSLFINKDVFISVGRGTYTLIA